MAGSSAMMDDPVTQKSQAKDTAGGSIAEAIQSIENGAGTYLDDDPVTISHYSPLMEQMDAPMKTEPVVGWLVCVEGPARGTDYRLHAGYNYIGRESGDVRIRGDQQISRQNHAMVAYDSGEHLYFVGPSAGRNLIKVNGHAVLQAAEIKNYDVISIGTTKLIFVGLCGQQFSWEKRALGNG